MSHSLHRRLQQLFDAVVELPPAARTEFLDRECADDDLRSRVEALLAADETATESAVPEGDKDQSRPKPPPTTVGNYRILYELGRGGMGVVYLAERADGSFERRVALKVLRSGLARGDSELLRRFQVERQILASLDHPHIARLLDGGALEDGSPFLVMEYVDGRPIDRFVEEETLSVEQRVQTFLAVCDAVQTAHQSLVVHRDLKPSNVLVTEEGVPKLLDFGIAKLLEPQTQGWDAAETQRGHQPLTPRYASPEQLLGEPVTTASDVYALGVLLYELLTGQSPYRPSGQAPHHWAEAVCEQEPRPPSSTLHSRIGGLGARPTRLGWRQVARRLRGDLDHIVLMALRKQPAQRYATAADLAADLRRHFDGLPVLARRSTWNYRAGKFVRRHRWGLAVSLVLLGLVGSFTVGLQRQLRRTEVERDKARTVTELLVDIFGSTGPSTGDAAEPTAREVLDRGLEAVEAGLSEQPEVQAALLDAIGRVYNNLGRPREAERAHRGAVERWRERRLEAPVEYAESLSHLAQVLVARGELQESEAMHEEALEILRTEVGEEDRRTIAALDGLQSVLSLRGDHGRAAAVAERVLASTLRRAGLADVEAATRAPIDTPELTNVVNALGSLASSQRQLGRYAAAQKNLQSVLTIGRRSLGEDHFGVAFALNNLANVESGMDRPRRATELRGEAMTIAAAALGPDHPSVALMEVNQAVDLCHLGHCKEARRRLTAARGTLVEALGDDHPVVASVTIYLGRVAMRLGEYEEAERRQRGALERLLREFGNAHSEAAFARASLAATAMARGLAEESRAEYQAAIDSYRRALGPEHPDTLDCLSRSVDPLLALGRYQEAREILTDVASRLELREDLAVRRARTRYRLARAQAMGGALDEATQSLAERALAVLDEAGLVAEAKEIKDWLEGKSSLRPPPNP